MAINANVRDAHAKVILCRNAIQIVKDNVQDILVSDLEEMRNDLKALSNDIELFLKQ